MFFVRIFVMFFKCIESRPRSLLEGKDRSRAALEKAIANDVSRQHAAEFNWQYHLHFANFDVVYYDFAGKARTEIG